MFQLTDILFSDFPRVRLDRTSKANFRTYWEAPPTVHEEPEDGECMSNSDHIGINTTLGGTLGECLSFCLKIDSLN